MPSVVGKLSLGDQIGIGSTSSVVYKGLYEKRTPVAIKRILKEDATVEPNLVSDYDRHENIVRYYTTEEDGDFYYIGMELCHATLEQLIKGNYVGPRVGTDKEVLLQIARAVEYLTDKGLVFRNINPLSIFVSYPDGKCPPKMKLVDFSISRKMAEGRRDLSFSGVVRNGKWAAPEIQSGQRYTAAVDVFSAGCVFAYFLSGGLHPFGTVIHRQNNIAKGLIEMPRKIEDRAAVDLIERMLQHNPADRIGIHDVLTHPYFWDEKKCLDFIQATCSTLEPEAKDPEDGPVYQSLENGKGTVFTGQWTDYISEKAWKCLFEGKFPMKNTEPTKTSMYFLLKAIRHKWVHFNELDEEGRDEFGQPPEKYFHYWAGKFPGLLVYTWGVMKVKKDVPEMKCFYTKA